MITDSERESDQAIADAAGYIADAVATAYLGPAGGAVVGEAVAAIAQAILGADDDRYEKEILSRLDSIETKIDSIILFFNTQLKELISDSLNDEQIRTIVQSIHASSVSVRSAISVFNATRTPTETDADRLLGTADRVLEAGYTLFSRSKDRYLVAIPYFTNAMAAIILARSYNRKYDKSLITWARSYRNQIAPWLTEGLPGPASLRDVLAKDRSDLATAQMVLKDFSVGTPVIYIVGVAQGGYFSIGYGAQFVLNSDFSVSVTYLGPISSTGTRLNSGDDLAGLLAGGGVFANRGQKVHHMIAPMFGDINGLRNASEYWTYYSNEFVVRFDQCAKTLKNMPERIKALNFSIEVLEPFENGLQRISSIGLHLPDTPPH